MEFIKMQGAGNDFLFILDWKDEYLNNEEEIAKKICNRRFGVGADGAVFVRKSQISDAKMIIINSDGSRPNMCGNAIRCFGKYLYEKKIVTKKIITVETGDGVKELILTVNDMEKVEFIRVYMGIPSFDGKNIPVKDGKKILEENILVCGEKYKISTVLMGVPHTVVVEENKEYNVEEGSKIEKFELFPEGTNVNFVQKIDNENIKVRTWERGAGATLACGTGCCASVVILNLLGVVKDKVNVYAPGGRLFIEIEGKKVYMTGEAEFICEGLSYL